MKVRHRVRPIRLLEGHLDFQSGDRGSNPLWVTSGYRWCIDANSSSTSVRTTDSSLLVRHLFWEQDHVGSIPIYPTCYGLVAELAYAAHLKSAI